jgi:hypothetical protein
MPLEMRKLSTVNHYAAAGSAAATLIGGDDYYVHYEITLLSDSKISLVSRQLCNVG